MRPWGFAFLLTLLDLTPLVALSTSYELFVFHETTRPAPRVAAARAPGPRREGRVPPVQLEQLPRAGDGQALRGVLQVLGRADLLLGQRGVAGEALGGRQGLRHVRPDHE